jgi:hypothetical protein
VELLIDRVLVTDGQVEIRYAIPLNPDSERVRFCHLRKDYYNEAVSVAVTPICPGRPGKRSLIRSHWSPRRAWRRIGRAVSTGCEALPTAQRTARSRNWAKP